MWSRSVGRAQVTLFRLDLTASEIAACHADLDAGERRRADSYRHERDRNRFIARRGRLRALLAHELECAPGAVRIASDAHGKPFVPDRPRLRFNLSHSRDIALCAVGRDMLLGCDIEWRDPELACPRVAERLFAPRERDALARLPERRWVAGFYNCWTRKEAFVKALGLGLSYPLDAFSVSVADTAAPALRGAGHGWSLRSFEPLPGYQAALAIGEGPALSDAPYGLPRAIAIASRTTPRANMSSHAA